VARKRAKKDSPFSLTAVAVIAIAVLLLLLLFIRYGDNLFPPPLPEKAKAEKEVLLYFTDAEKGLLKAERRSIGKGDLKTEVSAVIDGLITGPEGKLLSTLPEGTLLLNVAVQGDVAYIDLSRNFIDNHPGGTSSELHTVYSLVNTITVNFSRIKEVQILIEGRRRKTLAGHIDINYPLTPDRKMVQ